MTISTKSVPKGMHTLTPHLVCANCADAIEFYKKAFGAEEGMRMNGDNGKIMHASMTFGDSTLMLMDEVPEWNAKGPKLIGGTPITLHMIVDDVDAAFAQALAAGAKEIMPLRTSSGATAMACSRIPSVTAGRSPRRSRISAKRKLGPTWPRWRRCRPD